MKNKLLIIVLFVMPFVSNGQVWSGSTPGDIYYDQGNVSIGANNTSLSKFTVFNTGASVSIQSIIDNSYNPVKFQNYSNTSWHSPFLMLQRSRGTFDSPLNVVNNDYLSAIDIWGYFNGNLHRSSQILTKVDGNPSGDEIPSRIEFRTTGNQGFQTQLVIKGSGNVGIGFSDPTYKLSVNGIISASEVKVSSTPNSDYVFEPNYQLRPINEVETFIKENQHLPDIPSAEEFKENGVGLGEMDNMLLRKVEELTLYVIEQQKELEGLKRTNDQQTQLINIQSEKIKMLENEK